MSDEKWTNVDAGPRQIDKLRKAIRELSREGQTHTELTGVVGDEASERRSNYWVPIGSGTRPEVVELAAGIRERFSAEITRKNVGEITQAYLDAVPEAVKSRPVVDKRRSQSEDAELKAIIAKREAAEDADRKQRDAMVTQVMAKAPASATRIIVAELHEDTSDPMTDYFSNKTTRTVAIGWGYGRREDFRALRAAAASFPETAHMASQEALNAHRGTDDLQARVSEDLERRDNYSMGKGNYLSDHGWDGAGSGWVVKSHTLPLSSYTRITEDAIGEAPATPEATTSADGITVGEGRNGNTEVRFPDKPSFEVRQGLKAHGFRWSRFDGCWYGKDAAYAASLTCCDDCKGDD